MFGRYRISQENSAHIPLASILLAHPSSPMLIMTRLSCVAFKRPSPYVHSSPLVNLWAVSYPFPSSRLERLERSAATVRACSCLSTAIRPPCCSPHKRLTVPALCSWINSASNSSQRPTFIGRHVKRMQFQPLP